jgi:hypothetical protein
MSLLSLLPALLFGFVGAISLAIEGLVDLQERRRRYLAPPLPPPRGFRPVVIDGGKLPLPLAMKDAS